MTDDQARRQAIEQLAELIADIPVAMLTTTAPDGSLFSRPMVNINAKFQGELWFFTRLDDPKVEEIRAQPHVNVSFSSPAHQQFVSVTGVGSIVQDAKRCELLWNDACKPWFPDGPRDPQLALIKIDVEHAEYWDANRNAMVAMIVRGLTGRTAAQQMRHGKVDW
jgi:general stress protein 26